MLFLSFFTTFRIFFIMSYIVLDHHFLFCAFLVQIWRSPTPVSHLPTPPVEIPALSVRIQKQSVPSHHSRISRTYVCTTWSRILARKRICLRCFLIESDDFWIAWKNTSRQPLIHGGQTKTLLPAQTTIMELGDRGLMTN